MALGSTQTNRNEYQEYFLGGKRDRCVGLTLSFLYADCLEIWERQPPGSFRAGPGSFRDCFYMKAEKR